MNTIIPKYFLATAVFCLLASVSVPAVERVTTLFEVKFAAKLSADWSWVRAEADAWRIEKSALILRVQPGCFHAR